MHDYTEMMENNDWYIEITRPTSQHGWFEHKRTGAGGGLWFEGIELIDYDGVFELPKAVADMLIGAGYDLTEILKEDD